MGIQDRAYLKDEDAERWGGGSRYGGGSGGGARGPLNFRLWTVNTWLIVICVAVFVVDTFLPKQWIVMQTVPMEGVDLSAFRASELVTSDVVTDRANPRRGVRIVAVPTTAGSGSPPMPVARQFVEEVPLLESLLHYSTQRGFFEVQFWRVIGFQFLHSHDLFAHLLFNMVGLFFFGPMVERYLGGKRYLAFYLLCGICGALLYTLLNVLGVVWTGILGGVPLPGLLINDPATRLVGASAGIFGVLMAGAFLAPNAKVLLLFVIPMRLRTLAYALVAFSFLMMMLGSGNAGGHAGHLGGAIAGFFLIRRPDRLHGFFDFLGRVDPTSRSARARRIGGRSFGRGASDAGGGRSGGPSDEEIDRILDKVHSGGLRSLTEKEKRTLQKASQRGRDGG